MFSSSVLHLIAASALLSSSIADSTDGSDTSDGSDQICYSSGVDFVDEGSYFINENSSDNFTCASSFTGCTPGKDLAEILFVDADDNEYLCSEVQTTPDNTTMISTCPFKKNQMVSGHNLILVFGNNNGGQQFAWQRDIYLTVGEQATTTITPTITFSNTITPVITSTITSTFSDTSTIGPLTTITKPSATARNTKTVRPPPVFVTNTETITRTIWTWTRALNVKTTTSTATCATPDPAQFVPDKPCAYTPTLVQIAALETPTSSPPPQTRFVRTSDRSVPIAYARARIAAARARRAPKAPVPHVKRAADAPTLTLTASVPLNTTLTVTASPSTVFVSTAVSSTTTLTLPPATVYSGKATVTTTLPTRTRTRLAVVRTTTTSTRTLRGRYTTTVVVVPSGGVEWCARRGGRVDL